MFVRFIPITAFTTTTTVADITNTATTTAAVDTISLLMICMFRSGFSSRSFAVVRWHCAVK